MGECAGRQGGMSVSINVGRSFPGFCSERGTNIDCPGPGRPESRLRRLSREMRDDLKVYIYPRTREPEVPASWSAARSSWGN